MDKAPNGIWSSLPALLAILAWCFSLSSSCVCSFVSRTVTLINNQSNSNTNNAQEEIKLNPLLSQQGIGFWAWQDSEGTCYSYTIGEKSPVMDSAFQASSILTTLLILCGGIIAVFLNLGTLFPVAPKHYKLLGCTSMVMCILSFSTLAIMGSSVCAPGFFQYTLDEDVPSLQDLSTSSCSVGMGSSFAIAAAFVWILVALVCIKSPLSASHREPSAYRGAHNNNNNNNNRDGGGMDDDGEDDDEATRLYRQRQVENEEKYRQLMSGIDNLDAGGGSLRSQGRLSLVREEDGSEDATPRREGAGDANRPYDDDTVDPHYPEQFDDEQSAARSQYSDEDLHPSEFETATTDAYHDAANPSSRATPVDNGRPSPQSVQSGGHGNEIVDEQPSQRNDEYYDEYDDHDDDESYSDDDEEYNRRGYHENDQQSMAENSDIV